MSLAQLKCRSEIECESRLESWFEMSSFDANEQSFIISFENCFRFLSFSCWSESCVRVAFGVRLSVVAPSLPNVVVKPALGSSNIIFVSGKRVAWFSMCEIEYSKNLSRNLFQLRRCAFFWRIKVASSDISPKSFKHSVWLVQQYCELHFQAHQFHMPISAWIKWLFIYLL